MPDFFLSPMGATIIFVVACIAGHQYRRVWKEEGPRWKLWLLGSIAAVCLLSVALVPLTTP